jgi:hypothetical protein
MFKWVVWCRGDRGGTPPDAGQGAAAASLARITRVLRFRASLSATVESLKTEGSSLRVIALKLDRGGVPSPTGKGCNHMSVEAVLI